MKRAWFAFVEMNSPDVRVLPATSSVYHGLDVPIPTLPAEFA